MRFCKNSLDGKSPPKRKMGGKPSRKRKELKPDVAVLDIGMPGLNGIEATRQIVKNSANAKVLVLTVHETDGLVRELAVGARGYLLKTDAGSDLIHAVNALRRNQTYFTPKVAEMLLEGYCHKPLKPEDCHPAANRLLPGRRRSFNCWAKVRPRRKSPRFSA